MKKNIIIALVVLVVIIIIIVNNIKRNINGEFLNVDIKKVTIFPIPSLDLYVNFKVINNSFFSFNINNLKVKIFESKTGFFITENKVLQKVAIPKGESNHKIELVGVKILGKAKDFLEGTENNYLVEISFKVFGINISFKENIKL